MFSPRFFYTLGLWLLLPYVFFHLLWRARKQPEYLRHIGERFGRYAPADSLPSPLQGTAGERGLS
ncbi:MAG: hypothetical protein LBG66_00445, partial [Gallionellaceae bacterium]|nr:hypothetical protein [Gallionellaceae bacterium]